MDLLETCDLEIIKKYHVEELLFKEKMQEVEVERKKVLNTVENTKMQSTIEALGRDTLVQMARAGPET